MRIIQALGALFTFAVLGGAAEAQKPAGTRDRLVMGSWECGANKTASSDRITARFDPTGVFTMSFYGRVEEGQVTMVLTLKGAWRYDAVADQFSEAFVDAHLDNIVVRGQPLSRAQFPGGEAAVQTIEQNFLRTYSTSPLYFTTLTEHVLVLTDSAGQKISCAR